MFKQYELEVKSGNDKTYKQYNVSDDLFIGVNKDEEFEEKYLDDRKLKRKYLNSLESFVDLILFD